MIEEFKWFNERAKRFPRGNWLYQVACFLYGVPKKKMTYHQIFLLFYGLNKKGKKLDRDIEDFALSKAVIVYAHNHRGHLPEEIVQIMMKNNKE